MFFKQLNNTMGSNNKFKTHSMLVLYCGGLLSLLIYLTQFITKYEVVNEIISMPLSSSSLSLSPEFWMMDEINQINNENYCGGDNMDYKALFSGDSHELRFLEIHVSHDSQELIHRAVELY